MKKLLIVFSCFLILGCSKVEYGIANIYEKGFFGSPQYSKLIYLYSRAAEKGYAPAQTWLANSYTNVKDSPGHDVVKGIYWGKKAAEQGYTPAQLFLSHAYRFGIGVPQNETYFYMWFYIAKLNGDTFAKINDTAIQKQLTTEQITDGKKLAKAWQATHGS
jgi:uncharacterized protein